jgi:DNA-binding CsgD family transcriptional regulator
MGRSAATDEELGATFRAAAGGDAAPGTSGISVPLEDEHGERYVAHILPLTGGSRRGAGTPTAIAALFLHRATLDAPELPETVARAYGLTQTELRVLMAIVHVGGVPETADALGIAETTVKTHLSRVFNKTGVNRQADLVKIIAGFAGPLAQ